VIAAGFGFLAQDCLQPADLGAADLPLARHL
jgi:hypothetical protein